MKRLANTYKIAIIYSNQVMADPGASAMFGPVVKPVGGHILAHASTVRIWMKKGKGEQRICKLIDHPCMPEAECQIQLTSNGIEDV
jgi:RecA/RadA recombinase